VAGGAWRVARARGRWREKEVASGPALAHHGIPVSDLISVKQRGAICLFPATRHPPPATPFPLVQHPAFTIMKFLTNEPL
jgi:hypothetical protein